METRIALSLLSLCLVVSASVAAQEPPERQMNVRQGPESVFDRPVAEILPALTGAKPTGVNGRVGDELVFWGYELADGRRTNLFGCALLPDVDCMQRVQLICTAQTTVLESREAAGKVVHRVCRPVAAASATSVRPGCNDNEDETKLLIGLAACN